MTDTLLSAQPGQAPTTVDAGAPAQPAEQQPVQAENQPDPGDWRAVFHGGDEKVKARLERYSAPQDFMRAFMETENRLRNGPKIDRPQEGWTPEQWSAWYSELGRPESPDDYQVELKLPEGAKLSDGAKMTLDVVKALGHELGFDNSKMTVAQQRIAELAIQQEQAFEKAGMDAKARTEEALQQEWGYDYERNVGYANAFIAEYARQTGADANEMLNLRLEDGTRLGSFAPFIKFAAAAGRDLGQDPNWLAFAENPSAAAATGAQRVVEIMAMRSNPNTQAQFASEAVHKELATLLARVPQEQILAAKAKAGQR